MATWKKVIVSGSNANLASLQVDNFKKLIEVHISKRSAKNTDI